MYKYIFGPVNSRRFGSSLGIDLSPDIKSCNFDCLYCELEKSKPTNKIENEPSLKDILEEVKDFLSKNPYPDVITITANGEPTLYSKLDELVDGLNKIKGKSKLLILSNASTVTDINIQKILGKIDIVKFSLDSVNPDIFRKVDRPLNSIDVNEIVEGIKEFRKKYKGTLIIEVLIVKNINDKPEGLKKLADILKDIKPDRVDIGTVDRPPAYRVFPLSNEELVEISKYFTDLNINIVYNNQKNNKKFDYTKEQILSTLKRRPLTLFDIENLFTQKAKENFLSLKKEGKIYEKSVAGVLFFTIRI